ncbi:MAG: succinate dehydrogenase, cytochrome b556 subunit [Azospirillaceae bacterium]|nr:succinate dehydrogenase, cytochrome b556 subunit [Azospirillaceae bacterium]
MSETSVAKKARPLSPHLQVYRLPLPAVSSITHRITGIALTVGTLVLTWWLIATASGPDDYDTAHTVLSSPIGLLCLLGWTWAFAYHLLKGISHLIWDTGVGITNANALRSSAIVFGGSIVLTAIVWIAAFAL